MRVTIIPDDQMVSVDGVLFDGIDMSSVPANVHAVQWYDTWGEVEYKDQFEPAHMEGEVEVPARIVKPVNEIISDMAPYQPLIDRWQQKRDAGA